MDKLTHALDQISAAFTRGQSVRIRSMGSPVGKDYATQAFLKHRGSHSLSQMAVGLAMASGAIGFFSSSAPEVIGARAGQSMLAQSEVIAETAWPYGRRATDAVADVRFPPLQESHPWLESELATLTTASRPPSLRVGALDSMMEQLSAENVSVRFLLPHAAPHSEFSAAPEAGEEPPFSISGTDRQGQKYCLVNLGTAALGPPEVQRMVAGHELGHCLPSVMSSHAGQELLGVIGKGDVGPELASARLGLRFLTEAVADAHATAVDLIQSIDADLAELSEGSQSEYLSPALIESRVAAYVERDSIAQRLARLRASAGGADPLHRTDSVLVAQREAFWVSLLTRSFIAHADEGPDRASVVMSAVSANLTPNVLLPTFDIRDAVQVHGEVLAAASPFPRPIAEWVASIALGQTIQPLSSESAEASDDVDHGPRPL